MATPRFFVDQPLAAGAEIELGDEDAHHAAHVLRLDDGAPIVLLHEGAAWDARLASKGKGGLAASVIARRSEETAELTMRFVILQAVIKGNKFDEVVEKCVELGAARIVPVICDRSYADAGSAKVARWRRIARSAAQQSRRQVLPRIDDPMPWVRAVAESRPLVVAWEGAPAGSLESALGRIAGSSSLALAVGPEGSFTGEELSVARRAGAEFVSLGPAILRTETAAAALLAALASRQW